MRRDVWMWPGSTGLSRHVNRNPAYALPTGCVNAVLLLLCRGLACLYPVTRMHPTATVLTVLECMPSKGTPIARPP